MKTRLICLLLVAVMMISCLAGCAKKTDDDVVDDVTDKASESAMTLRMLLMSEQPVSAEQEKKIEAAVNKITESKFKTQIDLVFYTESDYYNNLDVMFAERAKEISSAGAVSKPTDSTETTEEETYFDESTGLTKIKYPEISKNQVDIFYMGGYDNYTKYSNKQMLSDLTMEISGASKKLNEYIATSFLTYMKAANKSIYAVPSNVAIGEYTYLLFNEEALNLTHYNTPEGLAQFDSITAPYLESYLKQISDYRSDKYVPLYTELSNIELAMLGIDYSDKGDKNTRFWGVDENGQLSEDFSLVASDKAVGAAYKDTNSFMEKFDSVLNTKYMSFLKKVVDYREKGYIGTQADLAEKEAAVICVQGGAELPAQYEGYVAVKIGTPTMETLDLYNDMMAVSTHTASLARSMEIVTYLNTNSDFRNLLLYGIEGDNYELVDNELIVKATDEETGAEVDKVITYKSVKRLNDNYVIAPEKVGNTLIGAYGPNETPVLREKIMEQNRDVSASITMGLTLTSTSEKVNMEKLESLRVLSKSFEQKLNACVTVAELEALAFNKEVVDIVDGLPVSTLIKCEMALELEKPENIDLLNAAISEEKPDKENKLTHAGINFVYRKWAESVGIWTPPEENN